jgi:hypothetical protein
VDENRVYFTHIQKKDTSCGAAAGRSRRWGTAPGAGNGTLSRQTEVSSNGAFVGKMAVPPRPADGPKFWEADGFGEWEAGSDGEGGGEAGTDGEGDAGG